MADELVVVTGFARSGTSIMFVCLERSGYVTGGPLVGDGYNTERVLFQRLNQGILKKLGCVVIGGNTLMSPPPHTGWVDFGKDGDLKQMYRTLRSEGITVLKDIQVTFALRSLVTYSDWFRDAKYIWMRRNPVQAAKSHIRLKGRMFKWFDEEKARKLYIAHDNELAEIMPSLNSLEVKLEDLRDNVRRVSLTIADFIGRPFNFTPFIKERVNEY